MRACFPLWLVLSVVACTASHGEEPFPYRLTVTNEGVEVRSGPGERFYITDRLPAGSDIEVYRRHEGDWLGIRPPSGSFSWVRGDQLAETNQPGVARILSDDTVCRVGSRVAEVGEHVGQVYLQQDELVEILDQPPVDTQTARKLEQDGWRRIAPPAGEFRWVRVSELESTRKPNAESSMATVAAESTIAGTSSSDVRLAGHWEQDSPAPLAIKTAEVLHAVSLQATEGQDEPREKTPKVDVSSTAKDAPDSPAAFEELQPEIEEVASDSSGWVSRGRVSDDELLEIETRLTLLAARDVHTWRLQPLRARVETVLPNLKTDAERQSAKRLLNRIAEYEELQNRFALAGEIAPLTTAEPVHGSIGAMPPPVWEDNLLSRFDGSGWLVPVHSTRRVAPPYALLDDEGEVLHYVAPTPGLNLHRYLRKRVGLYGQRGQAGSLNKPLITAERVVDLDRHLR